MSRCGLRKLLFSSNVQLLCVITQSTGHTFLPSLPIGKKLGSNVTFMFSKKLCAKFNSTHRVIFLLTFPLFLVAIACFGTCSDLSSQSCRSTANGTKNIPQFCSYLRAAKVFCLHSLERKAFLQKSAYSQRRSLSLRKSLILFITLSLVFKVKLRNFFHFFLKTY